MSIPPDLSTVEQAIVQLLRENPEYHPEGGPCAACANELAQILRSGGFDLTIMTVRNKDFGTGIGRPPVMTAQSPDADTWIIATDGYHKTICIDQTFYLDSLVIAHFGVRAVDEDAYRSLWQYPDDIDLLLP